MMRRPLIAFAGLVALLAAAAPAAAVGPGLDGLIGFETRRAMDNSTEIYRMAADGGSLLRLTNNNDGDGDAAWSPDGGAIAFTSNRDPDGNFNAEIFTMRADGFDPRPITATTDPVANTQAAWSPDGTRIAFTRTEVMGDSNVWVVGAGGGAATQLTITPGADSQPDWSPDGSRIVFSSDRTGNLEIFSMRATDGGDVRQLTNDGRLDDAPSWSPDGGRIAFRRNDGQASLWVMGADGSDPRDLAGPLGGDETVPAWSPEGTRLAFVEINMTTRNIAVINADGTGFRRIGPADSTTDNPSWQPLRPAPAPTALSPGAITAGTGANTVTVTGGGFVRGSRVRWNGADRPTTYVNSGRLTAQIPASDLAAPGTATVTVFTPAPAGGLSGGLALTVAPAQDLAITRARARGRWGNGALTGSVALRGAVTRAAVLSAQVRTAKGRLLRTRRVSVGPGAFALSLKLPRTALPGPLQVSLTDVAPAGGGALPTRTAVATLAAPPQGVADRHFMTTAPQGAPRARVKGRLRVLYAVFRFAALPAKRRPLTVVWSTGSYRRVVPATAPAGRTVVSQFGSIGAGVLVTGVWRATLRSKGVVVATARILLR